MHCRSRSVFNLYQTGFKSIIKIHFYFCGSSGLATVGNQINRAECELRRRQARARVYSKARDERRHRDALVNS